MWLIIITNVVIGVNIIKLASVNHKLIILITIIVSLVLSVSVAFKISNFVK